MMRTITALVLLAGLAAFFLLYPAPFRAQTQYLSTQSVKSTVTNEKARKTCVEAVDKAMRFFPEYIGQACSSAQYGDYVVFCGASILRQFPEYQDILGEYHKTVIQYGTFSADYPYYSVCHIMALDVIGEKKQALDIYSKLKLLANDGNWDGAEYHLGWYLYASIVADDYELRDKTLNKIMASVKKGHEANHYFTAYCMWKVYEKTGDEKYRKLFLSIVKTLKPFKQHYLKTASTDGHMGMTLAVFCTAYMETHDKDYRDISKKLADILLKTQETTGSWNERNIAYTIMPAEGLYLYSRLLEKK